MAREHSLLVIVMCRMIIFLLAGTTFASPLENTHPIFANPTIVHEETNGEINGAETINGCQCKCQEGKFNEHQLKDNGYKAQNEISEGGYIGVTFNKGAAAGIEFNNEGLVEGDFKEDIYPERRIKKIGSNKFEKNVRFYNSNGLNGALFGLTEGKQNDVGSNKGSIERNEENNIPRKSSGIHVKESLIVGRELMKSSRDGYNGTPVASCDKGKVINALGICTEPDVSSNLFVYSTPGQQGTKQPPPEITKPKLNYNIVFVNKPKSTEVHKPIIVPSPQQKTLVYILKKENGVTPQVIEVPSPQPQSPEVFYVSYSAGENPQLPIGTDLESVLSSVSAQPAYVIEGEASSFDKRVEENEFNVRPPGFNGKGYPSAFPASTIELSKGKRKDAFARGPRVEGNSNDSSFEGRTYFSQTIPRQSNLYETP